MAEPNPIHKLDYAKPERKMYACPHCGQPGITRRRKSWLGPAIPTHCRACGKAVGVPYGKSFIANIPLFAGMILSYWLVVQFETIWSICVSVPIVAVGFAISLVIYLRWVPLIRR